MGAKWLAARVPNGDSTLRMKGRAPTITGPIASLPILYLAVLLMSVKRRTSHQAITDHGVQLVVFTVWFDLVKVLGFK